MSARHDDPEAQRVRHYEDDTSYNMREEHRAESEEGVSAREIAAEQAEDEGLWFAAKTASEAYLQQELRRLTAAVESAPPSPSAREAVEKPLAIVEAYEKNYPDCCGSGTMFRVLKLIATEIRAYRDSLPEEKEMTDREIKLPPLREIISAAIETLEWHYANPHPDNMTGFRQKVDAKALRGLKSARAAVLADREQANSRADEGNDENHPDVCLVIDPTENTVEYGVPCGLAADWSQGVSFAWDMCQQHINDALDREIDGAARWYVVKAYLETPRAAVLADREQAGERKDKWCPHAAPLRYCEICRVIPCAIGVGVNYKERDWPEDRFHENGSYQCRCVKCGELFIGHKRRAVCKACRGHP